MLFENEIDNDIVESTFNYILQSETEELPENNRWINSHSRAWKVNRIRGELRRIKNGRLSDQEKIDILKNDLFWAVEDGKPTGEIVEAIALLQQCKSSDRELDIKAQNSIDGQFSRVIMGVFWVTVIITAMSYIIGFPCGDSQSKICVGSRVIPDYIYDSFREPPHYKSRVLPADINL